MVLQTCDKVTSGLTKAIRNTNDRIKVLESNNEVVSEEIAGIKEYIKENVDNTDRVGKCLMYTEDKLNSEAEKQEGERVEEMD